MNISNRVRLEFFSLPENVSFARACAAAFAVQVNCTLDDIEEIKLVVSEAVSNAVIHGYANQASGTIVLDLRIVDGSLLEIIVEDYGVGMEDVEQCMQPSYSTQAERMGLGFSFMRSFADELEVVSEPGRGTSVRMVKRFVSAREQLA